MKFKSTKPLKARFTNSLFEPQEMSGKYKGEFIISPDHPDYKALMSAIETVAVKKWGEKAVDGLKSGAIYSPVFKDEKDGSIVLRAKSKERPKLTFRNGNGVEFVPENAQSKQYPHFWGGASVLVSVTLKAYSIGPNKSVAAYLNEVFSVAGPDRKQNANKSDFEEVISEEISL
jgi:hypothetical protein